MTTPTKADILAAIRAVALPEASCPSHFDKGRWTEEEMGRHEEAIAAAIEKLLAAEPAPAALVGEPEHVYRDFRGEPAPAELQAVLRELDKPAAEPAGKGQELADRLWSEVAQYGLDVAQSPVSELAPRRSLVKAFNAVYAALSRPASAPSAAQPAIIEALVKMADHTLMLKGSDVRARVEAKARELAAGLGVKP